MDIKTITLSLLLSIILVTIFNLPTIVGIVKSRRGNRRYKQVKTLRNQLWKIQGRKEKLLIKNAFNTQSKRYQGLLKQEILIYHKLKELERIELPWVSELRHERLKLLLNNCTDVSFVKAHAHLIQD